MDAATEQQLAALLRHPFIKNLMAGKYVPPLSAGARTDIGVNGEENAYISGATIIVERYDREAAAWRTETYT